MSRDQDEIRDIGLESRIGADAGQYLPRQFGALLFVVVGVRVVDRIMIEERQTDGAGRLG